MISEWEFPVEKEAFCVKHTFSGKYVASLSSDWILRLHDSTNGDVVKSIWNPNTAWFAVGNGIIAVPYEHVSDAQDVVYGLRLFSDETLDVIQTVLGHTDLVFDIAVSTDSRLMVSGGFDKSVRLWRRDEKGKFVCSKVLRDHSRYVFAVDLSPNNQLLATGGLDRSIKVYNTAVDCTLLYTLEAGTNSDYVISLKFFPGSTRLCSVSRGSLREWNLLDNKVNIVNTNPEIQGRIVISPAGKYISSFNLSDNQIMLRSARTLEVVHTFRFREGLDYSGITSIASSICGTHLISAHNAKGIVVSMMPTYKIYSKLTIPTIIYLRRVFTTWDDGRSSHRDTTRPTFESALDTMGFLITHGLEGLFIEVLHYAHGPHFTYSPVRRNKRRRDEIVPSDDSTQGSREDFAGNLVALIHHRESETPGEREITDLEMELADLESVMSKLEEEAELLEAELLKAELLEK